MTSETLNRKTPTTAQISGSVPGSRVRASAAGNFCAAGPAIRSWTMPLSRPALVLWRSDRPSCPIRAHCDNSCPNRQSRVTYERLSMRYRLRLACARGIPGDSIMTAHRSKSGEASGSRPSKAGITRRSLLRTGALATFGLSLPSKLLQAETAGATQVYWADARFAPASSCTFTAVPAISTCGI